MRRQQISRHAGRVLVAAAILAGSLAGIVVPSGAEPNAGDLDVAFNATGVAETAIVSDIAADDMARMPDGDLLALADGNVWRFDGDGGLDVAFGGNGVVDVATNPGIFPVRLAAMPDGRFVVAGFVNTAGEPTLGAARFLPDGTLDPTFGNDTDGDGAADQVPAFPPGAFDLSSGDVHLVLQSTGHTVVVGVAESGAGFNDLPAVGRISPAGAAGDVRVITPPTGAPASLRPLDASLTFGNRVLISIGGQLPDAIVALRLEADLDLDAGFGGDGFDIQLDPQDVVFTIDGVDGAARPDGSVAIAAAQLGDLNGMWLYRWTSNGTFLGRTEAAFDAPVDQTSIGSLVAVGADTFLAAMTTLDTDPDPQGRSVAVVRFDEDGDEEGRAVVAREGLQLNALAAAADDGGLVVAGFVDGTEGEQLMLTRVTAEPDPDEDFGDDGVATFTGDSGDAGESVAVTADDDVLVAGSFEGCESRLGFVLRHDEDGRLDTDFGGNRSGCGGLRKPGVALFSHPVHSVTVDSSGRVLAVGEDFDGDTGDFGVVARLAEDGTPDRSFGDGQPVRIEPPDDGIALNAVTVDDEDRIVVVGTSDDFQASLGRFFRLMVVRLLPDGTPDPSFNGGQPALTAISSSLAEGRAVAVQSDGKIVVTGSHLETVPDDNCCSELIVARFNEDGTPDRGFGGRDPDSPGMLFLTIGEAVNRGGAIAVRADGRIVVGAITADSGGVEPGEAPRPPFVSVLQLLPDGERDESFADDGLFSTRGSLSGSVGGLALDEAGNVVVAGGTTAGEALVARLTPAGEPDETFGSGGFVLTDLGGGDTAAAPAGVALDGRGRVVIGGRVADERGTRVLAARYHPLTVEPPEPEPEPEPEPPGPVVPPAITFNPAVGRAGQTTVAVATGFPPGAVVTFDWSQGIDSLPSATVAADGGFVIDVLVLPSETVGTRVLTATTTDPTTGLPLTASAPYLVTSGTSQPGDFVGRR